VLRGAVGINSLESLKLACRLNAETCLRTNLPDRARCESAEKALGVVAGTTRGEPAAPIAGPISPSRWPPAARANARSNVLNATVLIR
jgi:hypothetical protein